MWTRDCHLGHDQGSGAVSEHLGGRVLDEARQKVRRLAPPAMLVVVMGAKGASPVASSEGVDLDCLSHCKAARQEGWRPVPLPRWVMQYSQCGQQFLQVDAGSVVQMATS